MSGTQSDSTELIDRVRLRLESAQRESRDRSTPVATLTYAQSLDGSIAAADGGTLQLSNAVSQSLTHQLRTLHDAILVGIGTVLSDDPRLNVRLVEGQDPQPIVIDSRLRFPLGARLLRKPCIRPIVATSTGACETKERQLVEAGARVLRFPPRQDGFLDLSDVLRQALQMGIRTVMIEGGARIITSVLSCRLVDQVVLTVSPTFVGGLRSVKSLVGTAVGGLPVLQNVHYQSLAGDLVIRGDLRYAARRSDTKSCVRQTATRGVQ